MADSKADRKNFKASELGYPHIEELLEFEDFEGINKSFSEAYDKLDKLMADTSGGVKKQKSAQKAMKSYELTTQLMNELLQVKHQIVKMRKEAAKKK